jgi:Spy/CpxP family protein refolding chaperone
MFKTKLFALSILSFFVLGTSFLNAQDKKILKFKNEGPMKWEMKNDLNLTEDQKDKFDDLDLQHEKKMIDLRAELDKSKLMKRELIKKGKINKNDYLAAEERIMQAENKIQMEKAKLKMDKYALLDENQKDNFIKEREHTFKFNFDMDEFKDGMRIFREKMRHLPEKFDWNGLENDIEVEIDDNEI